MTIRDDFYNSSIRLDVQLYRQLDAPLGDQLRDQLRGRLRAQLGGFDLIVTDTAEVPA